MHQKYLSIILSIIVLPLLCGLSDYTVKHTAHKYTRDIMFLNEHIQQLKDFKSQDLKIIMQRSEKHKANITKMISIIFNLKIMPKEVLLVKSMDNNNIVTTYITINYITKYIAQYLKILYIQYYKIKKYYRIINQYSKQLNQYKIQINNTIQSKSLNNQQKFNAIRTLHQKYKEVYKKVYKLDMIEYISSKEEKKRDAEFLKSLSSIKLLSPVKHSYIHATFKQNRKIDSIYNNGITFSSLSKNIIQAPFNGKVLHIEKLDKEIMIFLELAPSYIMLIKGKFTPNVFKTELVKRGETIGFTNKTPKTFYTELNYKNSPIDFTKFLQH